MMKLKPFILSAAAGALMISASLAQQAPSAPPAPSASAKPEIVAAQKPDQWLASKFKGMDVLGADDKKIGEVSDILFDKEGKILAYVISAGGFLGVGAKDVALAPSAFQVMAGRDGAEDKLKIAMSENDLKQAQNFQVYEQSRATTGSGAPAGGTRPSPSAPSTR